MTAELIFRDHRLSGAEIDAAAARLAGGLADLGLEEGDVVAVMLRNDPAFIEVIQACRIAGCFYCPINWHFKAEETGYILRDSGARVLIVHEDLLPAVADAVPAEMPVLVAPHFPEVDAAVEDPAHWDFRRWLSGRLPYDGAERMPRGHMPYTSGTTGRPKGVQRRAMSPEERAAAQTRIQAVIEAAWGIRPGVRALVSAPLYHSAPSSFSAQAMLQGECLVLAPRFDPEETLALIERHRVDTVYLVPIMYVRLLRLPESVKRRYDLSSVRFVASTGAPCAPDVKQAMLDWWGPVIRETYASSETGMITIQDPESARRKPGSVGRPIGDAVIRIVGDDGRDCAPGEPGLVYCRQPAFSDFTYVNRPDAREAAGLDGLATVGDIGYLDEDGFLYICDRASDMVISGGVNIYPAEIEQALHAMPGVDDCAVFGVPDPEYGEALAGMVETQDPTVTPETVRAFLAERIADYKVPRRIQLVGQLPRDDNGKVAKHRLRERYWAGESRRI